MPTDNNTKSKKAYLESLREKLNAFMDHEDSTVINHQWIDGFMAAGFFSGLVSQEELRDEYLNASNNIDPDYALRDEHKEWLEENLDQRLLNLCSGNHYHFNKIYFEHKDGHGPVYGLAPEKGNDFPFVVVWSEKKQRRIKAYLCVLCGKPIRKDQGEEHGVMYDANAHKACIEDPVSDEN